MFVGFVLAPEFSNSSFQKPERFQFISGMLAGIFAAWLFSWGILGFIFAPFAFGFLAYTLKHWGGFVQIP